MSAWRVIITDSESMTGVAPVCETDHSHHSEDGTSPMEEWVFDCCPHPHLECWSEGKARLIAHELSEAEAEAAGS